MEYSSGTQPAQTIYLTQIIAKCISGYKFLDSSQETNLICDATGKWNISANLCFGKQTFNHLN